MINGVSILVVEDSLTQAEQLRCLLEENEYQVAVAHNGAQALAGIREKKPSVVISDIMMPEMDGYQLCTKIKEDESLKDIPVLLLTSLSDPTDVIRGLECGADNFITKPYSEKFLLSRINHILINRELRKSRSSEMGIEVFFAGKKHFLTSERIQIIDLLLSTYENAIQQKIELEQSYRQLQKAHETIKVLEANYRQLLERNADAMVVADRSGSVRYVNPAAAALFDCGAGELKEKPFQFPLVVGETREVRIEQKSGETVVAEIRVAETRWEGESVYLATLRDVTENVQLRQKLFNLSMFDELTGLYNRRGFLITVQQRLKSVQQAGGKAFLLFADLDNMKWINDSFGHKEGDNALIETASIFKKTFRESDVIGRIGGDEFAVFVAGAHKGSDEILLSRLKDNIDAYGAQENRLYKLSISVGLAHYDPRFPCSIDELLVRADRLMYEEKRSKDCGCGRS
ncbi:MAG: diguanylate cyclase [Bacillota bacterium]